MKPPVDTSDRDRRRRQRQISAYLSELRAVHSTEDSRIQRMLNAARPKGSRPRRNKSARPV